MGHRHDKRDEFFDDGDGADVLGLLQRLQQQMGFLERKIDRLIEMQGGESGSERHYSRPPREDRPSYRSKERPPSRGRSEESERPGRHHRDDGESSSGPSYGKPSGKKFYGAYTTRPPARPSRPSGKSSGKPLGRSGKPAGKGFGSSGTGKKKILFSKKKS